MAGFARLIIGPRRGSSKRECVGLRVVSTSNVRVNYLNEISWETEVWVAEAPSHLIHFNGERFLGPYEDP